MFKYRTIAKVLLLGPEGEKIISHLLLTDSNDFQVDLSRGCFFNDLPVLSVLAEARVCSLKDVIKYCKTRNLSLGNRLKDEGLLSGKDFDYMVNQDLEGDWCYFPGTVERGNESDSIIDEITDFIIKKVQSESMLSGFQYAIGFSEIEEEFGIELEPDYIECILQLLFVRKEVADVDFYRDNFDVTLYTDFAPNYREEDLMEAIF